MASTSIADANTKAAQHDRKVGRLVPELIVIGSSITEDTIDITPGVSAAPVADAMEILSRVPGAAVNRNGALSGQAQYRGLFGPRMAVLVDNMRVTPGGPNWMDSPLHYMPAGRTKQIAVTRGIASVSDGPGIGGLIAAVSKGSEFLDASRFQSLGDLTISMMNNDGEAYSGLLGAANSRHRGHVFGSLEQADELESGGGLVAATSYERRTYGTGYGMRIGMTEISLDYSHTDTEPSGTPALPLDIRYFDTDRIRLGIESEVRDVQYSFNLFYTDVEHGMDNFTLRPPPNFSNLPLPPFIGEDRRLVEVASDAIGFNLTAGFGLYEGTLSLGIDGNFATHDAQVFDPDFAPFFVRNFNDVTQDQLGVFAEWSGDVSPRWSIELGVRYTQVESNAAEVNAFPAILADNDPTTWGPGTPPFAVRMLRERFNSADRSVTDDLVDLVAILNFRLNEKMVVGLGYAHKTRPPSYIERYLWIPLEINSGLGDLNNYVGNIGLKPEESDQVELSLEWEFSRGYLAPRIFFRKIHDYIQGVAEEDMIVKAVSGNANGDPTPLSFANVDAELYGFDLVGRLQISDRLQLDGTLNYVRGTGDDINDNLYRIAPFNGRISLTYSQPSWSVSLETQLVAEQSKISKTIVKNEDRSDNGATPGYSLFNFYAHWQVTDALQVRSGIENLLDKHYTNHLAGFNRVANSSVAFGERLPGAGVNLFAQVAYAW